jgi:hypothetical protein
MTSSGLEPTTFQLVAYCVNQQRHCLALTFTLYPLPLPQILVKLIIEFPT